LGSIDEGILGRIDMSETHAYEARREFLQNISAGESSMDLAVAALQVAAEDDAIVSHSSVQLPVDAFIKRIDIIVRDLTRSLGDSGCSPESALKVHSQKTSQLLSNRGRLARCSAYRPEQNRFQSCIPGLSSLMHRE
jgi:hypothetical protein